jgi:DNA-binding NarL/FixJ family response regulator
MPIRILIVDDHPVLHEGITAMLEAEADIQVVGAATDAESGIAAFRKLLPDVTLMDLKMPGMGGLKGVRTLRAEFPAARVVVLTTFRGDANAREAIGAGAAGYLLKTTLRGELVTCIRRVHAGSRYVCADVSSDIATYLGSEPLTERELLILTLIAEGLENKRIGARLDISSETVKSHLTRIFEKLGAHNRTQAVHIALRRGMLGDLAD